MQDIIIRIVFNIFSLYRFIFHIIFFLNCET